jgi:crotonobetainyl-CoA:carnitine CoA-transferase CaiB-like acyl-CoA transferase
MRMQYSPLYTPHMDASPAPPVPLPAVADLRVVELGVWVAAPAASGILADWGADVIKVEAPAGDPMRNVFGAIGMDRDMPNPAYTLDNRGKRSLVLDLRDEADRARMEELLADAHVFLTNLKPDVLDKFGLAADSTAARHPHLVFCSVSGYGLAGPERDRPSYDLGAFWARSGLSYQLGSDAPLNARGGIGDHITSLTALAGILGGVLQQRATGEGCVVETSLLRAGAYVLGWDLGLQSSLGKVARGEPRDAIQSPLMNSYRTADERWLFLTCLEADRHLRNVLVALEREDLLDDERFAGGRALRKNKREVIAVLDAEFAKRSLDDWARRLDDAGVWWAPVRTPAEVLTDEQVIANDGLVEVRHPDGDGSTISVNGPITFRGRSRPVTGPAPRLGEHPDARFED